MASFAAGPVVMDGATMYRPPMRRWFVAPLISAVVVAGCGGGEMPSAETPAAEAPATVPAAPPASEPEDEDVETDDAVGATSGDPLVENTRNVARELCAYDGVESLAREFGVDADQEAVARAYAEGSTPGPHRDAAYAGCLEGLVAAE